MEFIKFMFFLFTSNMFSLLFLVYLRRRRLNSNVDFCFIKSICWLENTPLVIYWILFISSLSWFALSQNHLINITNTIIPIPAALNLSTSCWGIPFIFGIPFYKCPSLCLPMNIVWVTCLNEVLSALILSSLGRSLNSYIEYSITYHSRLHFFWKPSTLTTEIFTYTGNICKCR